MIYNLNNFPNNINSIATIGTFDGVHLGHQKLLKFLKEKAKESGRSPILITFNPHPRSIIDIEKGNQISLINTTQQKYNLLHQFGIEHIIEIDFDLQFAMLTGKDFIENILIKQLKIKELVIGYDHHFGYNRSGNFELLKQYANNNFFELTQMPAFLNDNIIVSSTKIRAALKDGNIKLANEFLGYSYSFSGEVTLGKKLGRTIGFPTANISLPLDEKLLISNGVFMVKVQLQNNATIYNGMMNIGLQPTVNGKIEKIEVHILDFDLDIYNQSIIIILIRKIRDTIKFDGIDALKNQLNSDKQFVIENAN